MVEHMVEQYLICSFNCLQFFSQSFLMLSSLNRSTENLSSFTKVTKKQKRKKRPEDDPPPLQHQRNGQQRRGGRQINGVGSNGSSCNGDDPATAAQHATAVRSALDNLPSKKSALVQSQSLDDGALKWSAPKTDLDLAADFPPLMDGPAGSLGFSSAPVPNVWPVLKPSAGDSLAVIEPTSASELTIQDPPDLTVQVLHLELIRVS
jgi:hypothetical protein